MTDQYRGTRVEGPPSFEGPAGRAWRVTLPPIGQRSQPDFDGTLGIFLVHAPGAHPLWNHYAVSVIHLRPIAGVKPATITEPGATHEFMIASLDPGQPLPSTDGTSADWRCALLRPIDVVAQFTAANDVVGDRILELAVRAIVDGYLSPDQDWRAFWKQSIATTAQHFADGAHGVGRLQ